jgi:hypothetical protein
MYTMTFQQNGTKRKKNNTKKKRKKKYLQEKKKKKEKKKKEKKNFEFCDYKKVDIFQMVIKMNRFKVEL